jgi:hypothetical protein
MQSSEVFVPLVHPSSAWQRHGRVIESCSTQYILMKAKILAVHLTGLGATYWPISLTVFSARWILFMGCAMLSLRTSRHWSNVWLQNVFPVMRTVSNTNINPVPMSRGLRKLCFGCDSGSSPCEEKILTSEWFRCPFSVINESGYRIVAELLVLKDSTSRSWCWAHDPHIDWIIVHLYKKNSQMHL